MQSRSLQGGPASEAGRLFSGRCHGETNAPRQELTKNYFVAEDEAFLDAVAAALDQLTADCKTALRWSHDDADADAAIQATEQSFCTVAAICKEAGLVVSNEFVGERHDLSVWNHVHSSSDTFASSCSSVNPMQESWANENATREHEYYFKGAVHPPPSPIQRTPPQETQQGAAPMTPSEEIVEVELTDLLTQSHEEMLSLQRVFEDRMAEAERSREEHEHRHAEEMQSLHEELANSRLAMDHIKQELLDSTTRKLEDMHSAITASQKEIEAGMKDQSRYWKSICQDLVVEKRDMAQKVAEERGKYTALKAHLANHDDASIRPSPRSHVRIRSARNEDSPDKMRLCELAPSAAPSLRQEFVSGNQGSNEASAVCIPACSTPIESSSRLVVVPNAYSVSEPSSVEGSPTHSSSSSNSNSKTGKPTFRRYYLAQKRENRAELH